jgi:hypothetical protein
MNFPWGKTQVPRGRKHLPLGTMYVSNLLQSQSSQFCINIILQPIIGKALKKTIAL